MEDKRDSADIPYSPGSDPSGSRSGARLSAKLRARMEKLSDWRISPSAIKAPKDACQFHGGHATVSKAFLLDRADARHDLFYTWFASTSYKPREYMQLCRQSPNLNDPIRWAADHLRDAGGFGDEEKDDGEEPGSDNDVYWRGEFVAVKKSRIGDNKDLERVLGLALRETEFLVKLDHRNIIKLKGFVEDLSKDIIWLVFPWARNGTLKDFVASRDWQIPERISLINDVAAGLEYLHSQKPPICHGDLKSFNVLVNSEHHAVITDFGSARHLTEHEINRQPGLVQSQQQLPLQARYSTLSKTITLTGNIYTLRWAAPELLNEEQMSIWSDIWASGWIAYEVLTNSIPFQDVLADAVVVERVIKGDLPSINEHAHVSLFENLCSLMTRCWNSNPSERPTAEDYLRAVSDMPMVVPQNIEWSTSWFIAFDNVSSEALTAGGNKARKSGDLAMAFACFTEAHRICTKIGDRSGTADTLERLAELHVDREENSDAISHYSKALQIHTEIGNWKGRADALCGLAEVHRLQNEYSEAIALYSEALQIRTDIGDMKGEANALSSLAQVYRHQNKYSEAIIHYSEALQICTDIGDKKGRADTLWGLAEMYRLRIEYNEVIALRSEGLQIHTEIDDRRARVDALTFLAELHLDGKEYPEASKLYSEVLQLRTDIGDWRGRADTLSSLAQVYQIRNEYSEAIVLYSEALQILTDIGDRRGRADALWGLGQVRQLRDEFSEAITLYSEALQICIDIGDMKGGANALSSLAQVYRRQNKYSEAIIHYSEALKIRPDIGDEQGKAKALWDLAKLLLDRQEYGEAIVLYSEVLQIWADIGDSQGEADALWVLAEAHRLQHEYSNTIALHSEDLQICPGVGVDAVWGLFEVHRPSEGLARPHHILF